MLTKKTTGLKSWSIYNMRNFKEEDFMSIGAEEELKNILDNYDSFDYLFC